MRWLPRFRSLLCSCALLLLTATPGHADELQGTPLLRRYTAEDYNATPQHYALATDQEGRLYVGNAEGVLRYDGDSWQLIKLPGDNVGRCLIEGKDGHIYVGSYDNFGWLVQRPDGQVEYQDLRSADGLPGAQGNVGIVWDVFTTTRGVYYRAEHALHFLSYDRKETGHWPLSDSTRSFYVQGDTLYARVEGLGFVHFQDGKFVLEPGGESFAHQPLPGMIPHGDWRLLIGDQGLFRADAQGIRPLPENPGTELVGNQAYSVEPLADGSFVVGTQNGELFRYGADYKLRQRVSLGSYSIQAMGSDHEGGLWAATEGDLIRMSLPSPWSFIGSAQGLRGTIFDYEWYDGALWLAGSRGLARLSSTADGRINSEWKTWFDFEGYALRNTSAGLLIGYRNGLKVLEPGQTVPSTLFQAEQEGISTLEPSKADPELMYGLSEENLFLLSRHDGHWRVIATLPLQGMSPSGVIETAPGEIWIGDYRGGPQRWKLDPVQHKVLSRDVFAGKQGLDVDPAAGTFLYRLDGQIHAVSGKRGYRFDGQRFVADAGPPFTLVDRPLELQVEETPLGAYAFTSRQLFVRLKSETTWKQVYLGSQLAAGYGRVRVNEDGVLRIATWSGLLQYDPDEREPVPAPLVLGFESIEAIAPDGQNDRDLPLTNADGTVQVPAGYGMRLRFGLVSMESGAEFRYRLHGLEPEQWSDWTDRNLYIRALAAGDYVLDVQARTHSGREATPTSYSFHVLPHWYEQWWAWLMAAAALLAAAAGGAQWYVRRRTERYLAANRRLESRIAERTRELEEVNRKLAELATEDALTGVSNRRALEQGLHREWFRCLDQRRAISVLMIDVDHFKSYNDSHGHLEGDVLLKQIAQRLQQQHDPKRELLARYGGEEFAMLLPGLPLEEACRRAEKIRLSVIESGHGVTVSIGVSGFVPNVQAEASSLLRRADAALYRAKRGGRNRVEADTD